MAEEIIRRDVTHDISSSYLEYAIDVIIARALPDVRDGLKPVHRRILYAMYEITTYSPSHTKSQQEPLAKFWENIILMVIPLYMMQWYVWLRISVSVIR